MAESLEPGAESGATAACPTAARAPTPNHSPPAAATARERGSPTGPAGPRPWSLRCPPCAPSQVRDAIRRKNGLPTEGAPAPADLFRARRYDRGPVVPKTFTKARRPAWHPTLPTSQNGRYFTFLIEGLSQTSSGGCGVAATKG